MVMDPKVLASLSASDALERLRQLPTERFEREAQRLQPAELVIFARLSVPPHPLIHHLVAVLHTVLLSLSLVHQSTSGLGIPPWRLLRLNVLTNVDTIGRKLGTRLARLRRPENDPRRKPLAMAQVRVVLTHVLMSSLLTNAETCAEILEVVGRVSTIAESIAAYVLLCAHYSLYPPPALMASPSKLSRLVLAHPEAYFSSKRIPVNEPRSSPRDAMTSRSWRCGIKHHGRYFLFRGTISGDNTAWGHASVFAIDCRHVALTWEITISAATTDRYQSPHRHRDVTNTYARSWTNRVLLPSPVVRVIVADHRTHNNLNTATVLSLLLQTSVASALFRHLSLGFQSPETYVCDRDVHFSMHVIIVSVETDEATQTSLLKLNAIGEIHVSNLESTLADLRKQLTVCSPRTRVHQQLSASSFRFFVVNSLVSVDDEPWRRAIELLPFVIVCVDESHPRRRDKTSDKVWRPWVPALSELSRVVGSMLAKLVTPQNAPLASSLAVSLYSLDQTIASSSLSAVSLTSLSVSVSSTVDTLLAMFVDWNAFVQFQQLQDSSAILQLYDSPQKPKISHVNADELPVNEEKLRPDPTPAELELLSLPHRSFCFDKEYMRPLYAVFTYSTRRKGYLNSPYLAEVIAILEPASDTNPVRLVVENDECVIHVSSVKSDSRQHGKLEVHFTRDRSCPIEMLMTMHEASVWCISPLPNPSREPMMKHTEDVTALPRWLRDVFRFVKHPTWDFLQEKKADTDRIWPFPGRFFHVEVPYYLIEQIVEATHWSKGIDWWSHWKTCDIAQDLLHPKYDAMCLSYPSFVSIDSVKFSKLLRECGLQPAYLTVGDAAFLFTTHRAPGSHYEMVYEGFANAMQWIAHRVPQSRHEPDEREQLRLFCFEWLLRAPSMETIWRHLVDRWRLKEKLQYMAKAAIAYCAATRIRANWKRFVIRRTLIETLTRMKNEREAAVKVQSVYKMCKVRKYYVKLRACAIELQLFLRARRMLRQLRREQAQLVDNMRVRLQRWMRVRLRVLRCWKAINAAWLARRARIREKRSRLVCGGVYQINSRLYRVSLYRTLASSIESSLDTSSQSAEYDLEVLEPLTSWFRSIRVSENTLEILQQDAETMFSVTKPTDASENNRWKLLVLMQRLQFKTRRRLCLDQRQPHKLDLLQRPFPPSSCILQFHPDPLDTSLGLLLFQGMVQEQSFYHTDIKHPTFRFVRLHLRSHDLTLMTYSPESSVKRRYTFTPTFVYQLFKLSKWSSIIEFDDSSYPSTEDEMVARSFVVKALGTHAEKLFALRLLLRYVGCHGTKPVTIDMMPETIEKRAREQRECDERIRKAQQERDVALVIMVQAAARRLMAIRHVQLLAQHSYTKAMDPVLQRVVYTYRRINDILTYEAKPHSLRTKDVDDPCDQWNLNENAASLETRYFNPLRGVFSKVNDVQAAVKLQRWFRRVMWTHGFPPWDLRSLSLSLLFHHQINTPTDSSGVDQITNYALQRHLIYHDYKVASIHYEAALKLDSNHIAALIGLAVLLIYSCRYPVKQTWPRGLELLDTAKHVEPSLSTSLSEIEQSCFRWATYLHPKNAEAFGNFAVFLQCVRGDLDKAEMLYRRAIDLDPTNEHVLENYLRLQRERTPEGIYSAAGPSKIAVWRAQELRRLPNRDWRELEDDGARYPTAARFFQNIRTGKCSWALPEPEESKSLV